jgi:dTDP-L-rhamnose 4-epimerase
MYEVERYVRANTYATATLLEFLVQRKSKIRRLVVASSMSIYGEGAYRCGACGLVYPEIRPAAQLAAHRWEHLCSQCGVPLEPMGTPESKPLFPTSVYAITKQDQEQLCLTLGRAYGIPTVALRYFNVYGTRQALSNPYTGVCAIFSSRLLNENPPVIFEDGRQSRDFVHVSDIVQANLLALKSDAALYRALNIGTGIATSILDLAKLLSDGLGKKIAPQIVGKYREGDIRHCVADISLARKLLDFAPKVGLTEGLAELLSWVRTQSPSDQVDEATAALAARNLVH